MARSRKPDPVSIAMRDARHRLLQIALFSGLINLLTMAGSLYMLQVYDRVIPSRNLATLAGLSMAVLLAYALQGYLVALRARMLARVAALFDLSLQAPVFRTLTALRMSAAPPAEAQQPLRDLDHLRTFLSGNGPVAFLDMPWMPVFLIVLFLFHPLIGLAALLGALAIVSVTLIGDRRTKAASGSAAVIAGHRQVMADATGRNAETIRALGMTERLAARWTGLAETGLVQHLHASDAAASMTALGMGLRYSLQSSVLGIGACLVVGGEASGGIIIASSIMMGRALAPIEIALSSWKQMRAAREALERLRLRLASDDAPAARSPPPPRHRLAVRELSVVPPGHDRPTLTDVSFQLEAGMGLALVGPSGSGKSTLARALVGVWPAAAGAVQLDGRSLAQWRQDDLGGHLGYLPQDVALLDGTIAMNIARFSPAIDPKAVAEAAVLAGVHDTILRLPEGYHTRAAGGRGMLSVGQLQRIGLARAIYGRPFLVVLDEPNAHQDSEGELALGETISTLRSRGSIVIVVSHRPSAIARLDMALVLAAGRLVSFGPKQSVALALASSFQEKPSVGQPRQGRR